VLRPLQVRVVRPEWAAAVISPAYDALGPRDRAEWSQQHPNSFLHVTRSQEDADDDDLDRLAQGNRAALDRLLQMGAFTEVGPPSLYVVELTTGMHRQRHIIGALAQGDEALLRRHERTRPDRVTALAQSFAAVEAWSSPISVAFVDTGASADLLDAATTGRPLVDHLGHQVRTRVWRAKPADEAALAALTDGLLYIVDGHHRAAAAHEWAAAGGHGGLLVAAAPASELRVLPFNRRVVGGAPTARERLALVPVEDPATPLPPTGSFRTYLDERWWDHDADGVAPADDELGRLDPVLLERLVLGPVFGLDGSSPRIDHVPGVGGPEELARRCDADDGVGFLVRPVPMATLVAAADRDEVLPPKSTWFDPKLRSGLFVWQP
jgi:uncharacterized protein (DUF1015 family)